MKSIIKSLPKFFKSLAQRKRVTETDPGQNITEGSSFFELLEKDIHEQTVHFEKFRGKKTLIVNLASKCGYTYQYEQLQKLHEEYGESLQILGFPCNDFGAQEPGTESEILEFCRINYGVSFPLFAKTHLSKGKLNSVYTWLSDPRLNGWNEELPSWNFCKYLVSEDGKLIKFYGSGVEPMSGDILDMI